MNLRKRHQVSFSHAKNMGKFLKSGRFIRCMPVSEDSDFFELVQKKKSMLDQIRVSFIYDLESKFRIWSDPIIDSSSS